MNRGDWGFVISFFTTTCMFVLPRIPWVKARPAYIRNILTGGSAASSAAFAFGGSWIYWGDSAIWGGITLMTYTTLRKAAEKQETPK